MPNHTESKSHVVLADDGEYFDEDPTFGRGVPQDPAGTVPWAPLTPAACHSQFLTAVEKSMVTTDSTTVATKP